MATINLTNETFESTVLESGTVLVDFWAAWCGPCRMFAPTFEKASEAHPDITFAKVDTEAERELAGAANITSIPTWKFIRDGILVSSQPGALPPASLEQLVTAVQDLDVGEVLAQSAARHPDGAR